MPCHSTIFSHCQSTLAGHAASHYLIGYSGGRDSHVLLDLLCTLRDRGQLTASVAAIHVNHQLNPQSAQWAEHCKNICKSYQLPLIIEVVEQSPKPGESIEAFAREQRYKLVKKHLKHDTIFLSAHHQRDQAETFLLQLMRGAGLAGLKAMPLIKVLGAGQHLRPLLAVPYDDIVQYASESRLNYITDESNDDRRFNRNYIRHEVLPTLTQRFPQAVRSIAQSAHWLAELPEVDNIPESLSLKKLKKSSTIEQKQQIRGYVKQKINIPLSKKQTQYVLDNHLTAAQDKQPQLVIANRYVLRRYDNELFITETLPEQSQYSSQLASKRFLLGRDIELPLGKFVWQLGEGLSSEQFSSLRALPLLGSQRFHPHTRQHSTTVKKLMHEAGIASWLRPFWFGLFDGDELVAIPTLGVARRHYQKTADSCIPRWIIAQKFARL